MESASGPSGAIAPQCCGVEEIAEMHQIAQGSVYNMVNEGRIPHWHVGRGLRFNADEVLDWFRRGGDATQGRFTCLVCQGRKKGR